MPSVADRTPCTAGCNAHVSRRTVRRHLKNGCPGSARRKLLHLEAAALAEHARLGAPRSPRGSRRSHPRDTSLTPPLPSIQRHANDRQCVVSPIQDVETPESNFDTRDRHKDFRSDTAGAGPSSRSPSPLLPPQARREPVPPEVVAAWLGDMSPEDYLSQQLHGVLAREGGCTLSESDTLLTQAFNYKVNTDISGVAFSKLSRAFPTRLHDLPSEQCIRTRVTTLAAFDGVKVDCCINSCIAYTGVYKDLDTCPYLECKQPRFEDDPNNPGKQRAQCVFLYIPLIPRLLNMYRDRAMAKKLRYRSERQPEDGVFSDIFDGAHYSHLCDRHVVVGGKTLGHRFFDSPRDIALGLSTDGFGPFKSRKETCWPLLAFNYNLPPSLRSQLEYTLCLGVIPGPSAPKEIDTFFEPFIHELEQLARGVPAYDMYDGQPFLLRAYLLACFGDMPAVAKLMCMKGHGGKSPCRACCILGVRANDGPDTNTYYVPLSRPFSKEPPDEPRVYDPLDLPRRTHAEFIAQAIHVGSAKNDTEESRRGRDTGISALSPLARLSSLEFPGSFPHDFMHLIFENVIPTLIDLWTHGGKFNTFGSGAEDYILSPNVWAAIGEACTASGFTIPSVFGCRVPNLNTKRGQSSAESTLLFTTVLGPALLRGRFPRPKYYSHFVRLVRLVTLCLGWKASRKAVDEIREGFAQWVKDYERLYYLNKALRLRACTLPLHALLHIADDIETMGPVWCYWAFPMERYCGALARAHKSLRYPYESINRYVLQVAQLSQIKLSYGLTDALDLRARRTNIATGTQYRNYPQLVFVPRRRNAILHLSLIKKVAVYLSGDIGVAPNIIRAALGTRRLVFWGRMQQLDALGGGDIIRGHALCNTTNRITRDASFVKYKTVVDRWLWNPPRIRVVKEKTMGYGRAEQFIVLDTNFLRDLCELGGGLIPPVDPIVLAVVSPMLAFKRCTDVNLVQYKVLANEKLVNPEIIDAKDVVCLVGRIKTDIRTSYIADRGTVIGRLDMLNATRPPDVPDPDTVQPLDMLNATQPSD